MTKTPIKPHEIRKGDLIRWEWDRPVTGGPHAGNSALEFVAESNFFDSRGGGAYYLLDRPKPKFTPVPTEALTAVSHEANCSQDPKTRRALSDFLTAIAKANA